MATKSSLYEYRWWIPTKELEDPNPTAFLVCQMSKKDKDVSLNKQQGSALMSTIISDAADGDVSERMKGIIERQRTEAGFDSDVYGNCINEIRNIYVQGELTESIEDRDEIIKAVAGLEDPEIGSELDDIIWRYSELSEVEQRNFTPSSGCNVVCRTLPGSKTKENLIVKNVEPGTKE